MHSTASPSLDPRSKILLLLLVSTVVMSPGGMRFVPAVLILAITLALVERAWSRVVMILVLAGVLYILGWVLPSYGQHLVVSVIAIGSTFAMRFVAVFGIGAHLVSTTSPTQLNAALRSWRAPRPLAVTLSVMLRFFPLVAAEAKAVRDALKLRGLTDSAGLVRNPIVAVERFTVPMIAASLRVSEDLSASAILRGLGSRRTPVAMVPPRFAAPDMVLVVVVALAAATAWLLPDRLALVIR